MKEGTQMTKYEFLPLALFLLCASNAPVNAHTSQPSSPLIYPDICVNRTTVPDDGQSASVFGANHNWYLNMRKSAGFNDQVYVGGLILADGLVPASFSCIVSTFQPSNEPIFIFYGKTSTNEQRTVYYVGGTRTPVAGGFLCTFNSSQIGLTRIARVYISNDDAPVNVTVSNIIMGGQTAVPAFQHLNHLPGPINDCGMAFDF